MGLSAVIAAPAQSCGPLDNDTAIEGEQRRRQHVQCGGPRRLSLVHCWRDLFGHPGGKDHELDAARMGGVLKRAQFRRLGCAWVRQDRDTPRTGHDLHEDFQALSIEFEA
jgi:hypothetical protein